MKAREITPEEKAEIARVIAYDPASGLFFHKVTRGRSQRYKAGSQIIKVPNARHGYITFEINKRSYLAHRVAWLLMTGEWPESVDHIDHNITNNKFANLRSATHQENMKNASLYKSNKTGVAGVSRAGNKWRATVNSGGKQCYLGEFNTFDEAVEVRKAAMSQHGYHANHGMPAPRASHV